MAPGTEPLFVPAVQQPRSFLDRLTGRSTYDREAAIKAEVPQTVPEALRSTIFTEANKLGVSPALFAQLLTREQSNPAKPVLIGTADKNDRGLMQINTQNFPMIQERFKTEYGMPFNPNNSTHSITAARMVLQNHQDQFKANGYTPSASDLIDSYNTGVAGFLKAKQGNPQAARRLERYQNAGSSQVGAL